MNTTTVLEVGGVAWWASSAATVEATLRRRPGVTFVEVNPVNQTATVTYDPDRTSVAELSEWVRDCGYHCAGRSVPDHVCDPLSEPAAMRGQADHPEPVAEAAAPAEPVAHDTLARREARAGRSPIETMGHGGAHAAMPMHDMVTDMRNRFLVALLLSIPITLWSPMGRDMLGSR